MKINKKEVMQKAVKLAKKMEGDWVARMKMALKMAWALVKKGVKKAMEFIGTEKQIKWAKDIYPKAIERIEEIIKSQEVEEYARKKELRSKAYDQYIKFFEEMKKKSKKLRFGLKTSDTISSISNLSTVSTDM